MIKIDDSVLDTIGQEIRLLEAKLDSHPYAATEQDYVTVDGQQTYSTEYLDNMPADFCGILGRYSAMVDVAELIEQSHVKEVISSDLKNHLNSNNSRFQISFDE
tara:strand:- start:10265 stop:10576 length:312 start_codon:yes stop_codon:yes gene_type:complete